MPEREYMGVGDGQTPPPATYGVLGSAVSKVQQSHGRLKIILHSSWPSLTLKVVRGHGEL